MMRRTGVLDRLRGASDTVLVKRCWGGCGRLLMPVGYPPDLYPTLKAEGRVRYGEYLCQHEDCPANDIAEKRR